MLYAILHFFDKYPDTVYRDFLSLEQMQMPTDATLPTSNASSSRRTTTPLNAKTYIDVLGQHLVRHAVLLENPVVSGVSGDA